MPTINIYGHNQVLDASLLASLKEFVAKLLSGKDIELNLNEMSIRIIESPSDFMIAELECEIKAHAFPERVAKQDEICKEVRGYLMQKLPELKDVKVWLILAELGHSR